MEVSIACEYNTSKLKTWLELHCPNPSRSKTNKVAFLKCGLNVERWVEAWRPKQGGN
jgi:hypothetical protein